MMFRIYYKGPFNEMKCLEYECDSIYYAERMGKYMFEKNFISAEVIVKDSKEHDDKNVGEEIHPPFFVWEKDYDD